MKRYVPLEGMRTNTLSSTPGGSTVRVVFDSHEIVYDRIKFPRAYVNKILSENSRVKSVFVNEVSIWDRSQPRNKFSPYFTP
jgi:hypothetical protein